MSSPTPSPAPNPAPAPSPAPAPTPAPAIVPTVGEIVIYTLTAGDADRINFFPRGGAAPFDGNHTKEGDTFPMIIARVWGDPPEADSCVNGQVILDGTRTLWVTSVKHGEGPFSFTYRD